ncbi:MAG: hypothetical protein RL685_3609 [Pseudomonadota bacterium]
MSSALSFTCFVPTAFRPIPAESGLLRTDYQLEAVVPVTGATSSGIEPGQRWSRIERSGAPLWQDAPFIGSTQHLLYTDAATRNELTQLSRGPSGPCAVMIPIRKSAAWWALGQEERQAHFTPGARPSHTSIGRSFAARIYRRLYHARYLPGSSWDFLTYFEFPQAERDSFRELLGILRDPQQNPEWAFVEREQELWFQKSS